MCRGLWLRVPVAAALACPRRAPVLRKSSASGCQTSTLEALATALPSTSPSADGATLRGQRPPPRRRPRQRLPRNLPDSTSFATAQRSRSLRASGRLVGGRWRSCFLVVACLAAAAGLVEDSILGKRQLPAGRVCSRRRALSATSSQQDGVPLAGAFSRGLLLDSAARVAMLIAMLLPCNCHVIAMRLPCYCHAIAMLLPCYCHAIAM